MIRNIRNRLGKFRAVIRNSSRKPVDPSSLRVELYTRPGCSLCLKAKDVIMNVQEEIPFTYSEVDISRDGELERKFGTEIPVVFVCGRKAFKYHVDESRLRKSLRSRLQ